MEKKKDCGNVTEKEMFLKGKAFKGNPNGILDIGKKYIIIREV